MNKKRILIICIVVILCIGIGRGVHLIKEKKRAELKDLQLHLFGKNWPYPIARIRDYSIDDFISLLGEPNRIQEYWNYKPTIIYTTLYYDTFCVNFIYLESKEKCSFANIMITDSNQKIWRNDIGIGSAKAEVEAAFRHVPKDPSEYYSYFDTVWGIGFEYTSNDTISEITLYPPW